MGRQKERNKGRQRDRQTDRASDRQREMTVLNLLSVLKNSLVFMHDLQKKGQK